MKKVLTDHEHDAGEEIPLILAESTGTSVPLSTARAAQGSSPSWDQLDKRYYYGLMPIAPFLVRLVTYPSNLVKTRLQSAPTIYPYKNTFDAFKTIVAKQGIVGLYRGMGFNMVGMLQDPIYMTTMELTKGWLFQKQTTSTHPTLLSRLFSSPASQASAVSFFSGSLAAMLVLTIAVPVDVVTQRLMIQQHPDRFKSSGKGGSAVTSGNTYIPPRSTTGAGAGVPAMAMRHMHTTSTSTSSPPLTVRNGFQMLNDIYHSQGLSGVYRGLGTSMFLYVPFCGILWSTFAGSRVICDQFLHVHPHHHVTTHVQDSHQNDVLLSIPHKQPWIKKNETPPEPSSEWRYMASLTTSALIAGIAASALTNPIDVIRTRLQVSDGASPTLRSIYRGMIREHGSAFRGLTSGLLARIMAGGPTNAILVSAYEIIKRVAVKKEQPRTIMTP